MHACVGTKSTGRRERLVTCLANMWLLPRVCPYVLSQVAGLGERLPTCLAHMRPLPCMGPRVRSQASGLRERLAAYLTNIGFSPVCVRMCLVRSPGIENVLPHVSQT